MLRPYISVAKRSPISSRARRPAVQPGNRAAVWLPSGALPTPSARRTAPKRTRKPPDAGRAPPELFLGICPPPVESRNEPAAPQAPSPPRPSPLQPARSHRPAPLHAACPASPVSIAAQSLRPNPPIRTAHPQGAACELLHTRYTASFETPARTQINAQARTISTPSAPFSCPPMTLAHTEPRANSHLRTALYPALPSANLPQALPPPLEF